MRASTPFGGSECRVPLNKGCLHHGHKGDPRVILKISGIIGERAQVILVWVTTLGVANTSHLRRLGTTNVKPKFLRSL